MVLRKYLVIFLVDGIWLWVGIVASDSEPNLLLCLQREAGSSVRASDR